MSRKAKARKEYERNMDFAQAQRKNYKNGFLSKEAISQLEKIEGWTWTTPDYINFKAFRIYSDGVSEPMTIKKHKPYGLPHNYRLTLDVKISDKKSIIMITKNNHILLHYDCVDKCQHKGCDCDLLINKFVVHTT